MRGGREGARARRCEGARVRGRTSSRARTSLARARARVVRATSAVSGMPVEISHARRGNMVPGEHPVVDAEHDVGEREVVVARRGQPLERRGPSRSRCSRRRRLETAADPDTGSAAMRREPARDTASSAIARSPGRSESRQSDRPSGTNSGRAVSCGGAVEKQPIRQALEPLAALHRIRSGRQLLDERRHVVSIDPTDP